MEICVQTVAGTVRGWTDRRVSAFPGIPYGEAPYGPKRFQPATAHGPWSGIRDATRFGPFCPQSLLTFDLAWCGYVAVGAEVQSEDCLTLNVWAPAGRPDRRLPVLFWIHGGGFASGGPAFLNTDGMALARRGDVVVVSITHRLNVIGHLFLGGVAGDSYRDSANSGLLDIVLALEWVRDNIAQFGGDPRNVTVFGQSGGGAKISCLLGMPGARGLFNGALLQSGVRVVGPTLAQADDYAQALLRQLDIPKAQWRRLLELTPEHLLQAAAAVELVRKRDFMEPGPVPDGSALPSAPIEALRAGTASGVRLMIGTCVDEVWPRDGRANAGEIRGQLRGHGNAVVDHYLSTSGGAAEEDVSRLLTADWKFRIPSIRFAEEQVAAGQADVYVYEFAWQSFAMPEAGAGHSLDIPFFFGTTAVVPVTAADPSSRDLEVQMTDALVAFATTGNPNHARLPEWPAYEPSRRATMVFNRTSRVEDDPAGGNRQAWDRVPEERIGV
jgi:para-nitrobenzyl esterase